MPQKELKIIAGKEAHATLVKIPWSRRHFRSVITAGETGTEHLAKWNAQRNRKFPEFPNFWEKRQPREVDQSFRNEFCENLRSIWFCTEFPEFLVEWKAPKASHVFKHLQQSANCRFCSQNRKNAPQEYNVTIFPEYTKKITIKCKGKIAGLPKLTCRTNTILRGWIFTQLFVFLVVIPNFAFSSALWPYISEPFQENISVEQATQVGPSSAKKAPWKRSQNERDILISDWAQKYNAR